MPIIIIFGILFLVTSYIVVRLAQNISYKHSPFYDFGRYFPNAGNWMFVLYLVGILGLLLMFIYVAKFDLKITPA